MSEKVASSQLHPGPGFRVMQNAPHSPPDLIDAYTTFPTADISDMLNRLYTMSSVLKNVSNQQPFVAPACTVKVFPGDNLMVHKALDIARPGDVIVIDAGASSMNGIIGDLIATKAKHRGIAAFIVDGLVRDIDGIRETGLPVYARGITPIGPLHRGPGEINYPISCGGIVVNPGDIICADMDGVVVVRQEFASEILSRLERQQSQLATYIAAVQRGEFSNAWVDTLLEQAQCEMT